MQKHGFKAAAAALVAVATLGTFAGVANAADGKSVNELKVHGAAQRIAAIGSASAKNVILFIGDGMGDSEITVARNYLHGVNGSFDGLDKIGQPASLGDTNAGTGQYTTFSLGNSSDDSAMAKDKDGKLTGNTNVGKITPVTDSSASGSSWATGTKTYNNAVDVDIDGNPQLNLIELAKAKGLATGNVTTAEIQDATPAVLESHSTERACYGPQGKTDGSSNNAVKNCLASQLKENGGIGSISEQLLDTRADVTIGGGSKYLRQTVQGGDYKGKTVWQQAQAMGYQTVENDVNAFKSLTYKENQPVLALMADGNMETQYNPTPALAQKQTIERGPVECSVNPKWLGNQGVALSDMTSKAIDLLKANPKSSNGFFLQVEGASIDKQDHAGNACGQIGETDDLDKAISAALKKVDLSDTLIIVTADHAHTSQIVGAAPAYALSTILKNKLGEEMIVSYGTADTIDPDAENPEVGFNDGSMEHTGTQLRIAASGPGAQRVNGLTDQSDNFFTIAKALGLASETNDQKALSNNAKVETTAADGKFVANASGFNGDAVLTVAVNGKTVTDTSTPVSGIRVRTAQTTPITLDGVKKGDTITVTGRQSGKSVTTVAGDATSEPEPEPGQTYVYRLFNPYKNGKGDTHLYTQDKKEYDSLIAAGWKGEGVKFVTTSEGKPVYRAYNKYDGSHLYTLSKNEIDNAVKAGWADEGIAWYVSDDAKVPVYRVYNAYSGEHFYTADKGEADNIVALGWQLEGDVAFNVLEAR
ncbi:alkaline phosphatase [Bifidobacterium oedipodis]|uniref:Alkaline phosphatase n=1 Tax=Bifidobacterium oedipodis TaxID=2675322 RepID=A0A7Y0HSE8_9BIFI|nr:alkaline phosphatase [Bifidobacterium sp. DSM 109957]NMM95085.1 alkaline phosphatase [Bifidobacterium sp. DSM 109957]